MNRSYDDILSRIAEAPSFWQKDGVPRFGPFEPRASTGVYAAEAALAEIACQSCDTRFTVLFERRGHGDERPLSWLIDESNLHYGDPPNTGCCPGGPSMTSETVRVLQYWRRDRFEWIRDESLEVAFRRHGDELTGRMRERAQAMADDPSADERDRAIARDMIVQDDALRAKPERTTGLRAAIARLDAKDAGR